MKKNENMAEEEKKRKRQTFLIGSSTSSNESCVGCSRRDESFHVLHLTKVDADFCQELMKVDEATGTHVQTKESVIMPLRIAGIESQEGEGNQ